MDLCDYYVARLELFGLRASRVAHGKVRVSTIRPKLIAQPQSSSLESDAPWRQRSVTWIPHVRMLQEVPPGVVCLTEEIRDRLDRTIMVWQMSFLSSPMISMRFNGSAGNYLISQTGKSRIKWKLLASTLKLSTCLGYTWSYISVLVIPGCQGMFGPTQWPKELNVSFWQTKPPLGLQSRKSTEPKAGVPVPDFSSLWIASCFRRSFYAPVQCFNGVLWFPNCMISMPEYWLKEWQIIIKFYSVPVHCNLRYLLVSRRW